VILLARWLLVALLAAWLGPVGAAAAPPPVPTSPQEAGPPASPPAPTATALRLFTAVETAWAASDAEGLASLVDTTGVRIAVKPSAPPTAALNRVSAAFLFQDPMRLVRTREFRIVRLDVSDKGSARATARWVGDWGGRQGIKQVRVTLTAGLRAGTWLLTEVRASD
jgi:hypothetical protein